jgi:hypothetical protein
MSENEAGGRKFYIVLDFLVNLGGPILIYNTFQKSLGEVNALILSSVPSIGWSLLSFFKTRKLDPISLLVLSGIVFSLIAILIGGDSKVLLIRESFVTGLFGLFFLGSLLAKRPFFYYVVETVASKGDPEKAREFSEKWVYPGFRHTFRLMTVVWGAGLVLEAILKTVLAFAMPINLFLVIAPIIGYAIYFGLMGWSFWYGKKKKKEGEERRAAAGA